ncbi:hypothetical protein [Beijerinckia sp. L45]|uniref:aromatic-ring hydroxylase C-terminal domain-containing protein n=1 Tax=Beijerinckia sp. L45 TaxID=1641855 RepID=UPI0034CFB12F
MSGLAARHDLGSPLDAVGRLIGDQPIRQGDVETTLYDLMLDGTGVLLDATTDGAATRLVTAHRHRIRCVAVAAGPSMLIRPDACLAWISEAGRADGLMEALGRWFVPDLMAEAKAG